MQDCDDFAKGRDDDWKQHFAEVTWSQKTAPILEHTKLEGFTVKIWNSRGPATDVGDGTGGGAESDESLHRTSTPGAMTLLRNNKEVSMVNRRSARLVNSRTQFY